jgi:hypothetical protein
MALADSLFLVGIVHLSFRLPLHLPLLEDQKNGSDHEPNPGEIVPLEQLFEI